LSARHSLGDVSVQESIRDLILEAYAEAEAIAAAAP
jgi:hypothetical protein